MQEYKGAVEDLGSVHRAARKSAYRLYFKRPMDFLLALAAVIAFSPLLLAVAVLIRIKLGSPVLFRQDRPGLNERIFTLYKFRTMSDRRDETGTPLPDGERLTKFGKCLRSTSLDELPELFNIMKGDMSVVGPRPLLTEYLPLYSEFQKHRHDVRPGLSGLAQVGGRNMISWDEKFKLDVQYTKRITFLGDWRIIARTIRQVVKREGINQKGEATMKIFLGGNIGEADCK